MNNEQGKEWYGIGIDDSELDKTISNIEKKFKSISETAEKEGKKMDDAFDSVTDSADRTGKTMEDVFDSTSNSAKKASKSAEDAFESVTNSAKKAGKIFEDVYIGSTAGIGDASADAKAELLETIELQKRAIAELERQIGPLEEEFRRLNMGTSDPKMLEARQKASAAFKEVKRELDDERGALVELEKKLDTQVQKRQQLRTELMNTRDEMAQLKLAGKSEGEEYKKLEGKLEQLGTAYNEVQRQQRALTTGGTQMAGVLSGFSALTGALSAYAGIAGLVGGKSEDLVKIQTRIQSLIAVTIGLQQISNTLHVTSAFRITTLKTAKNLWAAANLKVAATLGITNIQAQILMATLTLGLSVAITAIVAGLSVFISRSREAAKEQREFHKSIADGAAKSIADYTRLQKTYNGLGDDMDSKKKFIDANKKAFEDLGVSVNNVVDADNLFINNTEAFKKAVLERARAAAYMELAIERMKEAIGKELEAATMPDSKTKYVIDPETGQRMASYSVSNKSKDNALSQAKAQMGQAEDLITKSVESSNNATNTLLNAGLNGAKTIIEGTKAYWEAQRQSALATLDSLKDVDKGSKTWNDAVNKYNSATAKLSIWDLSTKKPKEDNSLQQISGRITASQLALEKSRVELMAQGRARELEEVRLTTKQKLAEIDKEEQQLKDAYKKANKAVSDSDLDVFTQRRKNASDSGQQKTDEVNKKYYDTLIERQKELTDVFLTDEQRKERAITNRYEKERKWAQEQLETGGMSKEEYDNFLILVDSAQAEESMIDFREKYKTIADQITDIEKQAALDRAKATTDAQKVMIDEWEKAQKSRIVSQNLMKDGSFATLLGNLDRVGTGKISSALATAKQKVNEAMKGGELTPTDFKTLIDAIEKGEDAVRTRNPFKALKEAVEEYKKQPKGEKDITNVAKGAADGFNQVAGALSAVVGGLKKMGLAGDEETQQLLGEITNLATSASDLAMGIATKNPVQIIQGTIGVVTSLFEIFDKKSRDAQREIRKQEQAVKDLQKAYKALEQEVKKALSTDYYSKQVEQARNLEQQIQRIYAMIRAEESKSKRKRDAEKIEGWRNEIDDLRNQAADIRRAVMDELMTTDLRSFSSQLASSMLQGYAEGMEDLESVVQGSIDDLMRSMITKQFDMLVAQKLLKPLFDAMERSINVDAGDFTFDENDLRQIRAAGQGAKNSLLEAGEGFRDILKGLGLETLGEQERQGAKKGIATASQESIDKVEGTLTNIQSHTFSISNDFKDLLVATNVIVKHIMNIDKNTSRLENIENDMTAVKEGINTINIKGVLMR